MRIRMQVRELMNVTRIREIEPYEMGIRIIQDCRAVRVIRVIRITRIISVVTVVRDTSIIMGN